MPDLYLGLDVGTKKIKAVIVSSEGEVLEKASVPVYDILIQQRHGFVERDPDALWRRVKGCLSMLELRSKISGICIDATSGTIVPIDRSGIPVYNLIMYSDCRAVEEARELRELSEDAREYEKYLPIAPQLVLPRIMWLKRNFDRFDSIHKILHESDYIAFRLTGSIATSPNVAGKSHALLKGLGYLEGAYEDVGIPIDLMPEVRPIGDVVGYIKGEGEGIGLPRGVPVINGVTDASAGDITSGALRPGQANVTIGTSLTVHAVVGDIVPDELARFYYKAYIGGSYLAGGFTNAGTAAMDSLSKITGMDLDRLTDLARAIPPGSDGLIACTELFGVRAPRVCPGVRGFFIGISEMNFSIGHIFRSMLECSAIALRLMLSTVEEVTGTGFYDLRVSGGASRNDLLMRIVADATGKVVRTVEEPDSALGSAMLAAWGAGGIDIADIARRVVRIKEEFHPNMGNLSIYTDLTEKYRRVVEALASLS